MLPNILLVLAVLGFLVSGLLFVLRRADVKKINLMQAALQAAESRAAAASANQEPGAARKPSKEHSKQSVHGSQSAPEVMGLRKEVAALRSQVATHRAESKEFAAKIREAVRAKENEVEQLTKDRAVLIETIKELESRLVTQTAAAKGKEAAVSAPRAAPEGEPDGTATHDLKRKVVTLERTLRAEREQGEALRVERQNLQAELRKWTQVALDEGGKPLDPIVFKKWKDRALAARVQYQMMRQLRELSDIKLSNYQSSVMRLSKFVFESTGTKAPRLGAGEVASDRYLAEALAALAARSGGDDQRAQIIQGATAQGNTPAPENSPVFASASDSQPEETDRPDLQGDLSESG